jgi:ABC-2 type transport system permease protein
MKGLLIKDLLQIKKFGKIFLLFALVFAVFSVLSNDTIITSAFIFVFLGTMIPVIVMGNDETCSWNMYALAMPISVRTLVISKYAFVILIDLSGLILAGAANAISASRYGEMTIQDSLLISLTLCGAAIAILSLWMPVLFKFGPTKSRLFLGLSGIVPMIFFYLAQLFGIQTPDVPTQRLIACAFPVFLVICVLLSALLSIKIMRQKEY